jgi:DNA repair exonuclease SbcCD ATPase subunit
MAGGKIKPTRSGRNWSPRSAASIQQENALQGSLNEYLRLKKKMEEELAELEQEKQRHLEETKDGGTQADDRLSRTLAAIEDRQRKLTAYVKAADNAKRELENFLAADSKQTNERRACQNALAQLARKRLRKDRELDAALDVVRHLAQEWLELTRKMEALGNKIELEYGWDANRYAALLESLPRNIAAVGQRWLRRFFGDRKGLKPYIVCDERLSVEENLSHSGLCSFGETVYLADEEAAELLREDRYRPEHTAFGTERKLLSPSIMAAAEFEKLKAEVAEKGCDLSMLLRLRHQQRVAQSQQRYKPGPAILVPLIQPTGMTKPAAEQQSGEEE